MKKAQALRLEEHNEAIPPIKTSKHLSTHDIRKHFDNAQWKATTEQECLAASAAPRCARRACALRHLHTTKQTAPRHARADLGWLPQQGVHEVAGGHIFRPDRTARFKHRVYHKIAYYSRSSRRRCAPAVRAASSSALPRLISSNSSHDGTEARKWKKARRSLRSSARECGAEAIHRSEETGTSPKSSSLHSSASKSTRTTNLTHY